MGYCCDRPDQAVWGRTVEGFLELWAEKAIEYSGLTDMFCGSLEDVDNSTDTEA